jgi:hypothetical protein
LRSKLYMDRRTIGQKVSDNLLPKKVADILYKKHIQSGDFYISGWSLVHAFYGFVVAQMLLKYNKLPTCHLYRNLTDMMAEKSQNSIYVTLLVIHTVWELIQFLVLENDPLSRAKIVDTFTDTVCFMLGAQVAIFFDKDRVVPNDPFLPV